jgi:hypothetical protein
LFDNVFLTKYYSGEEIKENEMEGAYRSLGERTGAYRGYVGRYKGKIPLGGYRHRW